jgi:phosphoglycolate phosphatase-like HAD superfamily hydrolase
MIRLVLFDIDGTLIRSGGAGEKAFARAAEAEFGITNGTARLHFAGRTDPSIVRDFFVQHGIAPSRENFQRFFDRYVFHLDYLLGQLDGQVLPGVHRLIDEMKALAEPPVLGLLTGNIRLGAQLKLTRYQLWQHFQTGGFGDDHEDRNQIAVIARERGSQMVRRKLRGEEMLVIGDTPRDIECGRVIEARVLAVATGSYSFEQLDKESPTWTVNTLDEILLPELCGGAQ